VDWHAFGLIAGWVIPAIVGGVATWLFERRPRLLSYFLASSAVTLKPLAAGQAPPIIHTHTVVIQNRGRKAAFNVRLGHNFLPAFSIFPQSLAYSVAQLPGGAEQILLPVLPPKSQVQINYVYFPPLTYNQIHAGISSDDGSPSTRDVVINPKPHATLLVVVWGFISLGIVTAMYGGYLLAKLVFPNY
jgi:hypothetical protein